MNVQWVPNIFDVGCERHPPPLLVLLLLAAPDGLRPLWMNSLLKDLRENRKESQG